MNEQEMMMNEKIKKREKVDTILAYVLLVFLLGAILFILYLKFIKRDNNLDTNPEEYTNNYITLDTISNRLNTSTLANRYKNDNVTFNSLVNNNSLNITYIKDDTSIELVVNTLGTELEFNITEDNKIISEDIYREVVNIICVYYNNTEDSCRSTISKINENNTIDGIRYVPSDNNMLVYVNTTKSIEVESIDTYTEVTNVVLSKTNYVLRLDTEVIENINITTTDNNISFTGNITSTNENKNLSVVITLYDSSNTSLAEQKYEFNDTNILNDNSEFKIDFTLSDELKLENINTYAISIAR